MQLIIFVLSFLTYTVFFAKNAEGDPQEKSMEDISKDTATGLTDFFKNAEETVKEKPDSGLGLIKDWTGGMASKLGSVKDKMQEHGSKIKSSLEESASNVKKEVEAVASNVSYHGQKALGFMTSFMNKE